MPDHTLRHVASATPASSGNTDNYLLHAAVFKVSGQNNTLDNELLGKLLRRRLSRLERVLATHGGTLVRHLQQGLLVAFDSAEQAVLVACEMQRRCAVIPQIMETQIGLKIGIYPLVPASNQAAAESMAARLAGLVSEGCIVAASAVVEALPETLREKTALLVGDKLDLAAHVVDWDAIPMRPAPASIPASPSKLPGTSLILRQGDRSYRFDRDKSVITIGRAPESDIVIRTPNASREHCRIVYRLDNHVLVDMSMNGTFVKSGESPEKAIRKNMVTLSGRGQIAFGHSCQIDGEHVFEFEIC